MVVLWMNIGCKFLMMVRYNSIHLVRMGIYPFPIRAQFYFLFQYDVHYSPPYNALSYVYLFAYDVFS
jgi:hypothetical protein